MSLPLEILDLALYCVQQLGVMLGVGAQTILLIADLLATRDGAIDKQEEQFLRATKRVMFASLGLIFSSGLIITIMHFGAGQASIVMEPTYLCKWLLIILVFGFAAMKIQPSPPTALKAAAGGTWYALFFIHTLALVATWATLLLLYAVWMVGFVTLWSGVVFALRQARASRPIYAPVVAAAPIVPRVKPIEKTISTPLPQPKPTHTPITELKPVIKVLQPAPTFTIQDTTEKFPYEKPGVAAPMLHPHLTKENMPPVPPTPPTQSASPAQGQGLPTIRVMPQKPQDLQTQHRGPLVTFG